MSSHNGERNNLSISWPFTAAGLAVTVGLVYFCLGFAIHDRKPIDESIEVEGPIKLAGHYTVFWVSLLVAAALIVGGIIVNQGRARRRATAHR